MRSSESLRRQLFRRANNRYRVAQIIQRLHRIHIQPHAFLPQKLHQLRIASSSLMTGYIEGNDPPGPEFLQRLVDRGVFLRV